MNNFSTNSEAKRPRILLFSSPWSPVPAVRGGAISELEEILIRENETYHKVDFIVLSIADEKAEMESTRFEHSKFIYVDPKASLVDRAVAIIIRIAARRFRILLPSFIAPNYYLAAFKAIERLQFDYAVVEGGDPFNLRKAKTLGINHKFWYRLHSHEEPNRSIIQLFSGVIGVSDFVTKRWFRHAKDQSTNGHVLYSSIDEERFGKRITLEERNKIRSALGFSSDDFIIIFSGRLTAVKGVKELIAAVNSIDEPHVKLLIMGDTDLKKAPITSKLYIRQIIRLAGKLPDRIRFAGYIQNSELYRYYQAADVQCVPSLWEEAGALVVLEGMCSGLPLIMTHSGGIVEYADEYCAIQVERGDNIVNNLTAAIIKLRDNPELRKSMSEASLKRSKEFTKRKYYDDFCAIFEKEPRT